MSVSVESDSDRGSIIAQKIKIGWFDRFQMGWVGGDIGSKTCVCPSTGGLYFLRFLAVSMKQTEQVIPGDSSVAASGSVVMWTGVSWIEKLSVSCQSDIFSDDAVVSL